MESSSDADKVNISASTYELVKDHVDVECRGKLLVKNTGEIAMYFVKGMK